VQFNKTMRATTRSFANCCLFALLLLIWQSSEIKIKSQRREEINNHTEFDNGRYHIV
jgi:hypothetical protein